MAQYRPGRISGTLDSACWDKLISLQVRAEAFNFEPSNGIPAMATRVPSVRAAFLAEPLCFGFAAVLATVIASRTEPRSSLGLKACLLPAKSDSLAPSAAVGLRDHAAPFRYSYYAIFSDHDINSNECPTNTLVTVVIHLFLSN